MSLAPFIGIDQAVLNLVKKELPHLNHGEHKALRSWIVNGGGGKAPLTFSGMPTGGGQVMEDIATFTKYAEHALSTIKGAPEKIGEAISVGASFIAKGAVR